MSSLEEKDNDRTNAKSTQKSFGNSGKEKRKN